ncbi:hypothetical protein SAMN05421839_10822 [Halolactibacillus halophilus]|uniref:PH domain-containing protein n=1 Tax=Halolactibacillus halophilus TaxID=306540 RepID=A0A1I5N7L3_9BACI|nr:hypothetical protein [Halolactibacillus halophilus]GEM01196.1 hypothetical protein HHA03_07280 [Halolactibacillus halophilus]SFP17905.1 hypothetical protein SAMN05421839_10822 [Halolactibacillus halophilus]
MTQILTTHMTTRHIIDNQITIQKQHDTLELTAEGVLSSESFYPYQKIFDVSSRRMTAHTFALYIHADEGVKTFLAEHDPSSFTQSLKMKINR